MNKTKHVFGYSSKLVDMQKLVDSLKGNLEIVFFCKHLEAGLNTQQQSVFKFA